MEKNILYEFPKIVSDLLKDLTYPRLELNNEKTVFTSKAKNMHITGLTLTNNGEISIGRKKKRYLRSLVNRYEQNELGVEEKNYLRGMLAFIQDVEPEFVIRLRAKYGDGIINSIQGRD